jgi:tRNA pseudouridine65 synthase
MDESDRLLRDPMHARAVAAFTTYRSLAQVELPMAIGRYPSSRYSLLEIRPHSGRRRQIRRHMKHIFHPIIGDVKYGEGRHNRLFRTTYGCHRLLLSAMQLSFRHPYTLQQIHLTARLDAAFTDIIRRLDWLDALPSAWYDANAH